MVVHESGRRLPLLSWVAPAAGVRSVVAGVNPLAKFFARGFQLQRRLALACGILPTSCSVAAAVRYPVKLFSQGFSRCSGGSFVRAWRSHKSR